MDVRVSSSADEVRAGETFYVNFKFSIPKGQHIYSAEESDLGQPTAIKLSLPQGYSLKNIEFPKPEKFTALGMESLGYSRDFSVSAAVSARKHSRIILRNIRADATWLACSDLCV
ncbi:MAG: protein-disulfide reductase DsbD domain-containing protein [Bacilli bacterium]